jgi:5-methylcytosine-specific restriction protein A
VAIPAVEKKVIEQALTKFDDQFRDQPEWAQWETNSAHKYAVRVNGKLYPAKKIISLATDLAVRDFMGGKPANGYLRARGFEIVSLRAAPQLEFVKGEIYDRLTEIHGPFGGSSQSGIAPSDKAPVIFLFAGSSGEQFGYIDEEDAHGVYAYTGEGQIGDMTLTRGNLAIQQHAATGRTLHLFKALGKSKGQQYKGEYTCADISWKDGPDRTGNIRKTVVFHLVPVVNLLAQEAAPPDERSAATANLTIEALRVRAYEAAVALETKGTSNTIRKVHARSQAVKDYVLRRAGGVCESCVQPAPFTTKAGHPYLEPHHINRLSDGGLDHPRYVGAICPTCHKEIHYGSDGEKKNSLLRQVIEEKERPSSAKKAGKS